MEIEIKTFDLILLFVSLIGVANEYIRHTLIWVCVVDVLVVVWKLACSGAELL